MTSIQSTQLFSAAATNVVLSNLNISLQILTSRKVVIQNRTTSTIIQ